MVRVLPSLNKKNCLKKIKEIGTLLKISKNTMVYDQSTVLDKIYFVSKGLVKQSFISKDGKEKLLAIEKPGSVFGQVSMFLEVQIPSSVITMEDTELYYLEKNKVLKLIKDDPDFSLFLIKNMAEKLYSATKNIEDITFSTPKERILQLIKEFCTAEYGQDEEWVKIDFTLSHDKIASILGLNRVTVSKLMAELRDEGILRSSREKIWLNKKYVS